MIDINEQQRAQVVSIEHLQLEQRATPYVVVQDYESTMWDTVKDRVMELNQLGFEHPYTVEGFTKFMSKPGIRACLLRTSSPDSRIVGITCAYPEKKHPDTAHIPFTVIHPDYQHLKLVGLLMDRLEEGLRKDGFSYITRWANIRNKWAAKIQSHYGDRIVRVKKRVHPTFGSQVGFWIKL